ncbi:MAG TPA: sigma 54-interacting transcriptional regulator [Symbiobacteriaceae bacterium]|jgi:transcriptional regulator with PAS, ATPase and Fis domain|nr:sigma 54-interacting transcriptional regulator [Symbiobacteriaceae bacterium]
MQTLPAEVLDAVGEALLIADGAGRVVALNRAMEELLGTNRGRVQGRLLTALEADGLWVPPTVRRCLDSGRRETLVQEVGGRRLALTADRIAGLVVSTVRDITELDRLQRQAERTARDRERLGHELAGLRSGQAARQELIASSRAMEKVLELARRVAVVDSTILLLGESGVGKGMLARSIHQWSTRAPGPFVQVDCAAIPESLLESELFGYEAGAFTGARREGKAGLIEQAHGGTLFLDEIGDLSAALQVKLLHVVQDRQFLRVGAVSPVRVDVRIIAATHRNLEQMVAEGRFRQDLFYRLHVVPLHIPPLRERPADIPLLVRAFVAAFGARYSVDRVVTPEAMERLMAHPWPGNVRELENLVERLVVTAEDRRIRVEDLPPLMGGVVSPVSVNRVVPLTEALEALELELVGAAYQQYGSSVKVGQVLGIHQTTAARKIREWKAKQPR